MGAPMVVKVKPARPVAVLQGFTWEFLSSLFKYDPKTGHLIRRVTRSANAKAGDVVGSLDGRGYLHVNILNRFVRVHRIVFFLRWRWAPSEVDHRDNDKLNNRISNLRAATRRQNSGNSSLGRNNTSGYRGVSFSSRSKMWHAQIKVNGRQTYLGRFSTPVEAARCYDRAARKHFGRFAKLNNA